MPHNQGGIDGYICRRLGRLGLPILDDSFLQRREQPGLVCLDVVEFRRKVVDQRSVDPRRKWRVLATFGVIFLRAPLQILPALCWRDGEAQLRLRIELAEEP